MDGQEAEAEETDGRTAERTEDERARARNMTGRPRRPTARAGAGGRRAEGRSAGQAGHDVRGGGGGGAAWKIG